MVLWRLAQLGDSYCDVFSCDYSQVAAGLESSESLRGFYVQMRFFSHVSGHLAQMADMAGTGQEPISYHSVFP